MFRLKLPTDPRWVNIVEKNIADVLTDHAWCEQKAASNAISIMLRYPEFTEMVKTMADIAQEELAHFKMVVEKIEARGWVLGPEKKDEYVNLLFAFKRQGGGRNQRMLDHLLFAALIEARSCERFRVLSENIQDTELAGFYKELMISEAHHYRTFIALARKYAAGEDADKRWQEFLDYEAGIISRFGVKQSIHG